MRIRSKTYGKVGVFKKGFSQFPLAKPPLALRESPDLPPTKTPKVFFFVAGFGASICAASLAYLSGWWCFFGVVLGFQFFAPLIGEFMKFRSEPPHH